MNDTGADETASRIRPISPPLAVPVFTVVLYVRHGVTGIEVRGANLPDLQATAATEPQALKRAVTLAKSRLASWHAAGEAIPWLQPPLARGTDETERLVAVHL